MAVQSAEETAASLGCEGDVAVVMAGIAPSTRRIPMERRAWSKTHAGAWAHTVPLSGRGEWQETMRSSRGL